MSAQVSGNGDGPAPVRKEVDVDGTTRYISPDGTIVAHVVEDEETGVETTGYVRRDEHGEVIQSFVVGPAIEETLDEMDGYASDHEPVEEVMHWAPSHLDDVAVVMGEGIAPFGDQDLSDVVGGILLPESAEGGLTEEQRAYVEHVGFDADDAKQLSNAGFNPEGVVFVQSGDRLGRAEFTSPAGDEHKEMDEEGVTSVSAALDLGSASLSHVGWGAKSLVDAVHESEGVTGTIDVGPGTLGVSRMNALYGEDMPDLVGDPGEELDEARLIDQAAGQLDGMRGDEQPERDADAGRDGRD